MFFSFARRTSEFDEGSALVRVLRRDPELIERLVGEEDGRDDALGAGRTQPLELAVELAGILREAAEIGLGVRRGFDRVIGVEEVGRVDVRADVLDHDVGRVAIAADGNVAVREGEALERGAVGAADGVDACAHGEGEAGFVDRFDARQVGLHRGGDRPHSGRAMVAQLGTHPRAGAGVDPERGRAFGAEAEKVLRDGIEQRARLSIGGGNLGLREHGGGFRKQRQSDGCAERGNGFAAGEFQVGQDDAPFRRAGGCGRVRHSGNCRQRR